MAELVYVKRKMKDNLKYNKDRDEWITIGQIPDDDKYGNPQFENADYPGAGQNGQDGKPTHLSVRGIPCIVLKEGSRCIIRNVPDHLVGDLKAHNWLPTNSFNYAVTAAPVSTEKLVEVAAREAMAQNAKEKRPSA